MICMSPALLASVQSDLNRRHSIGWTDNLNFLSYGEQFHKMRKLSQQPFTRQGCLKFREIQIQQTHVLLKNLLGSPHDFDNHAVR